MKKIKPKWIYIVTCVALAVTLAFFVDSIKMRWAIRHMPTFESIAEEQQIIVLSTYNGYVLRLDSGKAIMNDYNYAKNYLSDLSNANPSFYSMYEKDEYTTVWQLKEGYYRLSSIYDGGHKNLTLKVGRGKFTETPLFSKAKKIRNERHHF